jgi:ribonuclease T2
MVQFVARSVFGLVLLVAWVLPGAAQGIGPDRRHNEPGQFAFYVLSLSWSPSFCAAAAERSRGRVPGRECGTAGYSFIVHGLWPQYAKGFPQFCQVPAPRLDRALVSAMLDLMPARRLVFDEWSRHGTCSGLSPRVYFATVRSARAAVKIPPQYRDLQQARNVTPAAVETAFIAANPGLAPADVAVACGGKRLTEVRLCLTKDLKFRACPDVVGHACRRRHLFMPPVFMLRVHGHAAATAGGKG